MSVPAGGVGLEINVHNRIVLAQLVSYPFRFRIDAHGYLSKAPLEFRSFEDIRAAGDALDTKAVSGTGEGTHTTARRQLIVLDRGGMMFIDTPGMRELGILGASDGINKGFEDIIELSIACRYADCSHTQESDCAVLNAITQGELNEERYSNYMKLRKESEHYEMSYLEKRKKDRAFGRFVKTAKKNMKK